MMTYLPLHEPQKLERELEQKLQQEAEDQAIEEAIAESAKAKEAAEAAAQQAQPAMVAAAAGQTDQTQPDANSKQAAEHLLELSWSPFQNGKSKVHACLRSLTLQHCHQIHQKAQDLPGGQYTLFHGGCIAISLAVTSGDAGVSFGMHD